MEIASSFYALSSQRDDAYHREVKALIRRNHSEPQDGVPPPKRARLSQDSELDCSQSEPVFHGADGTIVSITMINFMCHGNLKLDFNPKVNFLIGQNGSGKSAILTAITVGLGAQARETGRGRSLKDLIKNGASSANVIIELTNKKARRLDGKPLEAGKVVTIKRTIGASSTVQIKHQNKLVSSKMESLHSLIRDMGIQINNPISVLDQNTSKTFLAQSTSSTKYELFMRATALDDIKQHHEDINSKIRDIGLESELKKRDLRYRLELNRDLCKQYNEVEALEAHRRDRGLLLEELLWAKVNSFRSQLKDKQTELESANVEYREQKTRMEASNEEDSFADDIERLNEQLQNASAKKQKLENEMKEGKYELHDITSSYQRKEQELKRAQAKILSVRKVISDYKTQIEKEVALGDPTERVRKQREMIQTLEAKANRLEKELEAKESEKFQADAEASSCEEELRHMRIAKQEAEERKNRLERKIRMVSQDESNLSIYGEFMPALVNEINAAAKSFRRKPVGPLGLYVKLLDESWGPAVESVIGNMLSSFCIDNSEDYNRLDAIMKRVWRGDTPNKFKVPSKFMDKIHNMSNGSVRAPPYHNIHDVLEFSHPVAANILIDKCSIERILLIPDDATCQQMLSDERRVPVNCAYAITPTRDLYFPAPLYRTYAGHGRKNSVRFLKTSKEAVLQNLKYEVNEAAGVVCDLEGQVRAMDGRCRSARAKAIEIDRSMNALSSELQRTNRELNDLRNQEEPEQSLIVSLREELRVREDELGDMKTKIKATIEGMKKTKADIDAKNTAQRELVKQLDELRALEKKIKDDKDAIEENRAKSEQQRESRREILDNLTKLIATLEKEVNDYREQLDKSREEAEKFDAIGRQCSGSERSTNRSRAMTRRKVVDIEKDLKAVDTKIATLQRTVGDEDGVIQKYQNMRKQVADTEQTLKRNENLIQALKTAMDIRNDVYRSLMTMNKIAIDSTFRRVLKQRGYKGSLTFTNSKMEINIGLSEDDSRSTSTLSGGERSFGTMALLIALWYVTKLPFYFMDEFDVFMDMANRETIMALMMDYTRKRNYQFCFLTPLNTSSIQADKDVTIHRLEPPRKNGAA